MDVATISAGGQVALPTEVLQRLQLGPGDEVVFAVNDQGETIVAQPGIAALLRAQQAFSGAADEAGLGSEDDVQALVEEFRYPASAKLAR
ncbi:MAG: AbrB/MazE/SpoVT family DNA-binding domain-containing protein [Micrococcales bacterium]|nr:AbrB/MazE/SpoVT family DNA-binding domain-containing protein [Micrococcales bacterium]